MKAFFWGFSVFVIWRVALFVVAYIAPEFFSYQPQFPYAESLLQSTNLPSWVFSWGGFDGVHYLSIMTEGYLRIDLIQAFFPLFPLLAKVVMTTTEPLLAALLVSNLATLGLILVWLLYTKSIYGGSLAKKSLVLLLTFPAAFFLGAVYSESLFLLAVLSAFWAAHNKRWLLAGVLGAVASSTRLAGVFIWPSLLLAVLEQNKLLKAHFSEVLRQSSLQKKLTLLGTTLLKACKQERLPLLFVSVSTLGFVVYAGYLQQNFNDPLYFFTVQERFNTGRSDHLIFPAQSIWRQLKILFTVPIDWKWYTYLQDLVLTLLVGGVLVWRFVLQVLGRSKKNTQIPYHWFLFSFSALLLPLLTGSLSSMTRYVMVCFPLYVIGAATLRQKKAFWLTIFISSCLLVLNVLLFIQGYWVA